MFFIIFGLALAGRANAQYSDYPAIEVGTGILQASSEWDSADSASRAILNFTQKRVGGRSWSAAFKDRNQWIQISTQKIVRWKSLLTQGRGDDYRWVKKFTVQYNLNGRDWVDYNNKTIFNGNVDRNTVVTNDFDVPLYARAIRILPITWHGQISMRLEAYVNDDVSGCECNLNGTILVPAIDSGLRVTSSSEWNPNHGVSRIRLNFDQKRNGSSSWCSAFNDLRQWVQISSQYPVRWIKINTQGRGDDSEWVTAYYVTYSLDGIVWNYADNRAYYPGNGDPNTIVTQVFGEPFIAKAIRIHPVSWKDHVCMRLEAYFEETA